MKNTKTKLISSVTVLLICFAMLIGSTFAWFTDNASTGVNKIQAGNLDVQLLMYDGRNYVDISDDTKAIFGTGSIAQNTNSQTLWEPGKTQVAYLAIRNNGNLSLKYKVVLDVDNITPDTNNKKLSEVMKYTITPDAKDEEGKRVSDWDETNSQTVTEGRTTVSQETDILPGVTHYFALSIHMLETASNDYMKSEVDFDLTVYAKQLNSESDSFDSTYDMGATYDERATIDPPTTSVGTAEELYAALNGFQSTGQINLTQDIDLEGVTWGSPTLAYAGSGSQIVINGNGHTIKNLSTNSTSMYGGLIGKISTNGEVIIKDLKLENISLQGNNTDESAGGALIGWYEGHGDEVEDKVTISNVTVNGISVDGYKNSGGLVGYTNVNINVDIQNCSVVGTEATYTINSSYNEEGNYKGHIGGLVGYYGKGTISNCSLANIGITRDRVAQSDRAGVLVGTLATSGASISSATVSNVTLLGTRVTSGSNMVGPGASTQNPTVNVIVTQ